MQKDDYTTDVIFRVDKTKDFKGVVFALFPHDVCDYKGNVTYYQHIGQHSVGDYNHCINTSRLATEAEYADLKHELENNYTYNLKVIKKKNHDKYLKSYKEVNRIK